MEIRLHISFYISSTYGNAYLHSNGSSLDPLRISQQFYSWYISW
jgi:hypothetical protein